MRVYTEALLVSHLTLL